MAALAGPSRMKPNLHITLPDRPNRWSFDTDQSTPSTIHEADFSATNGVSGDETKLSDDVGCDTPVTAEELEPGGGKTLKFLESLEDKIADELRMLEWEMTSKDDLLTEILGYHDYEKNPVAEDEDSSEPSDLVSSSSDCADFVENEHQMQSSLSSQSSVSELESKTMSESGAMADVETSGPTSPNSLSSNENGNHSDVSNNEVTIGSLTFFASTKTESTPQKACMDWYVKLLVNSIMRSVSVIFDDSSSKVAWQNTYSDLHLYNRVEEHQSSDNAEYIDKPFRFSRRFTDSNVFFGNTKYGYHRDEDSSYGNDAENLSKYGYSVPGTWYTSTEDDFDDSSPYYDGGIPPQRPWQAPWRKSRQHKPRLSEPAILNGQYSMVFENTNLNGNDDNEGDERMFHKVRYQMHDIHHQLKKLRNQIHGTND